MRKTCFAPPFFKHTRTNPTLILIVAALAMTICAPAAHAASCTLATVGGNYAYATLGNEAGAYGAALFRVTSDGAGNISGTGAESVNGNISTSVTMSGTYSITSDCWLTATFTDSLGNTRNIAAAVYQNGVVMTGISLDASTVLQFTAYRQTLTSCTVASAAGHFVGEQQSPETPFGPSMGTNQITVNKLGQGTGSFVANVNGTVVASTLTVVFAVNSNCTFTATNTNGNGTVSHSFGVGGIKQNDVSSLYIGTDSGWVSLGTGYKK